jgi:4-amino-4-deoxy-L-arabinose transferase-like glycosyltransferase
MTKPLKAPETSEIELQTADSGLPAETGRQTPDTGLGTLDTGRQTSGLRRLLLPLLLAFIFLLIILYLARLHPYGTYTVETDFYQYYAPDSERLAQGEFPQDTYRGPGYAFTLAVVTKLTGDVFLSGKLISAFSAALIGFFTFLLFERLFGYAAGLGAQLIVFVCPQFPSYAVTATTDIFFLMLCLAAMVIFLNESIAARWRIVLSAALTSFAYLTRYNALFLLATILTGILLLNLFTLNWRQRLQKSAIFIGVFLFLALPWFTANYKHQGSPFYNTNHLNIATEFYPDLANNSVFQEGTRGLSEKFRSLGDVLRYDPKRIAAHYPANLFASLKQSVNTDLVDYRIGWLAVIGLIIALIERRSKAVSLVLLSGAIYFLINALTHWETRYYFYVMVLYAGLASYALFRPLELLRDKTRFKHPAFVLLPISLLAVLLFYSFGASRKVTARFLATHPTEIIAARDYVQSQGVASPRIVARKPHLSYMTRGEWIFFPQVKSLDELKEWLRSNPVDYVAFGIRELQARPELEALKDPAKAPAWLQPVWTNDKPSFVLYKPQLD